MRRIITLLLRPFYPLQASTPSRRGHCPECGREPSARRVKGTAARWAKNWCDHCRVSWVHWLH